MKSKAFSAALVSLLFIAFYTLPASACGPYYPIIPNRDLFALSRDFETLADYDRVENLKLWQSLTSERIPLADIEQVVYRDSYDQFDDALYDSHRDHKNLFYTYLINTNDMEIRVLLSFAKLIEEERSKASSPWYYPRSRDWQTDANSFSNMLPSLKSYSGKRLRDRYALQVTRVLFSLRRYTDCIVYSDSAFAEFPDDNLMKRMAQRYVAGCWSRLGETQRADSIFAKCGDILSLSCGKTKAVEMMAELNPNAPQLMEFIRYNYKPIDVGEYDTTFIKSVVPIARLMVNNRRVKHKGDWNFLLSYVDSRFYHDTIMAKKEIDCAMHQSFSSDELKDRAWAFKMKIDGMTGNLQTLLADLKWLDGKMDALNPDARKWANWCQDILYVDWIPRLWKKKDYATAILLCSYADNLTPEGERVEPCNPDEWVVYPSITLSVAQLRDSERYFNWTDYRCLSFQMMEHLTSSQLASAYSRIMSDTPLYNFLRRTARTDRDYYYELIGTLALREENYARATSYLSKVSEHYLRTMNIYDECYRFRDPFNPSDCPAKENEFKTSHNVKLTFARKMRAYQVQMAKGKNADERGLARLMYAIGRFSSLKDCWALTQYSNGDVGLFVPMLSYWDDDIVSGYEFLYEPDTSYEQAESTYDDEIATALAMLTSDEAKAKANYILGNLITVVKLYGKTATAQFVKTSCDNWHSWL